MTEQEVRQWLERWWDGVWRSGDADLIGELFADPYLQHSVRGDESMPLTELKRRLVQYQRVLHHSVTTIDSLVLADDTAWLRATSVGVNLETHDQSTVTWVLCYRFHDGVVAEAWVATVPNVDWRRHGS